MGTVLLDDTVDFLKRVKDLDSELAAKSVIRFIFFIRIFEPASREME